MCGLGVIVISSEFRPRHTFRLIGLLGRVVRLGNEPERLAVPNEWDGGAVSRGDGTAVGLEVCFPSVVDARSQTDKIRVDGILWKERRAWKVQVNLLPEMVECCDAPLSDEVVAERLAADALDADVGGKELFVRPVLVEDVEVGPRVDGSLRLERVTCLPHFAFDNLASEVGVFLRLVCVYVCQFHLCNKVR